MLVLILAVASFVAFVSIGLMLWLADTLEAHESQLRQKVQVRQAFVFLSIAEAFEPMFAVLWEAPIAALELIESAGQHGIPVSHLHPIFNKAAASFPEIYDGHGFEHWLQFFEDAQLIDWRGQEVTLTREGRDFLECTSSRQRLSRSAQA
jgi:hypothetical protein